MREMEGNKAGSPHYNVMPRTLKQRGTQIYLGTGLEFATVTGMDHAEHAERIVRACNAHDDLVKALKAIVEETMDYPPAKPYSLDSYLPSKFLDTARAALTKAGAA